MSNHVIVPLERLALAPDAMQLAVRGWLELCDRGYGNDRAPPFTVDTQAFVAIVENGQEKMLGGVLAFTAEPQLSRVWIDMAYVLPEFRGTGAYRAMWDALVKLALYGNFVTVEGATAATNATMRAIAKKLRNEEKAIQMVYKVQP